MKALLSREASIDHLQTNFPALVTEGSGPRCMAYHLACDLCSLTNWLVRVQSPSSAPEETTLETWPWKKSRFICSILEQNQSSARKATEFVSIITRTLGPGRNESLTELLFLNSSLGRDQSEERSISVHWWPEGCNPNCLVQKTGRQGPDWW